MGGREYIELPLPFKCVPALFRPLEFSEFVRLNGFFVILPWPLDHSEEIMFSFPGEVRDKTDLLAL